MLAALQQRPYGRVALLWEKRIFPLAYRRSRNRRRGKNPIHRMRDDEWALNYEMPPLKIMQIRLAGLSGSIPRTAAAPRSKLKWMGRAGNSRGRRTPALGFARLVKRQDPT